jgi:Dolichyl-phosphate-mannose-protein mannosyltransferase
VPELIAQDKHDDCPPFATLPVAAVAVTAGIVAALSATRYGYYYDELYFIAAGKRPSFSYVDQGPFVPLLARSMDWLFPGSFAALRIPAIVAALVVVVVSAVIARELGGGRAAQVLAAAACSTSFCILGGAATLSTNGIDTALWMLLSWLVVRWVRTRQDGLLLIAGLVTVAALQVKMLVPVFWIAILLAAGCEGRRELVRRPALWWSALAVAVTAIPMLIWQARHGWPQVGMGAVVRGQTNGLFGSLTFIPRALVMCGVLGAVLLVYGAWRLWRSPHLRPYRFLGFAFLLVAAVFTIMGGRTEYGAGIYAAVMAAGAVELAAVRSRWTAISAVPAVVLSIATFVVWATPWRSASQIAPAADFAAGVAGQAYGEFGWSQLTSAVANAYQTLPPEQRSSAVIVTERYIQASALDYNRSVAGLPPIFSPKRGFGYFGAPPDTAETVLWVGSNAPDLRVWFTSVAPVAKFGVRLGMPLVTRDITIWKCTGPTQPWSSMWPKMRTL